uniref:Protein kinase domain-containing protein n=1 Tax=Coccidioides posadasii RMSCC 3488 TaxID=454284 RepID=A0A0J6IN08_COCPO|nr:hypothetical protein CPAG_09596 [Coccidioides posadasii RMSCC 3488]
MSPWPLLSVAECWFDPNKKELKMIVRCKGKCFHIFLSPDYFHDSPDILEKYLQFAETEVDGDLDNLTIDDFQDWALEPFLPVLQDTEPAWEEAHVPTLHDYLYPETFHYLLLAINNTLVPSLYYKAAPASQLGFNLDGYELHTVCSSFHPRQIQICVNQPKDIYFKTPKKVLVDGQTVCFFKQWGAGEKRGALHELQSYKCIEKLLNMEVQIPRLCGVVLDDEGCHCIGMLLSWIDCQYTTLECALRADPPMNLRQKWADQLAASLDRLHLAGVIWGDVKPANVLVDTNDDIWIIDFGGGYTRGWVEREIAGTVEGDKQGLQKIKSFLLEQDNEANCGNC